MFTLETESNSLVKTVDIQTSNLQFKHAIPFNIPVSR